MMKTESDLAYDRATAAQWATDLLQRDDWVIFDTETTGLTTIAEIIEVGVLGPKGQVLIDALVKPQGTIEPAAQAVHGITTEKAAQGLPFPEIYRQLCVLFHDRQVIIYNENFDKRMLHQCSGRYEGLEYVPMVSSCAMLQYARWVGDWQAGRGTYRWQRLPGAGHRAIEDCLAVYKIMQEMAASFDPAVIFPASRQKQVAK